MNSTSLTSHLLALAASALLVFGLAACTDDGEGHNQTNQYDDAGELHDTGDAGFDADPDDAGPSDVADDTDPQDTGPDDAGTDAEDDIDEEPLPDLEVTDLRPDRGPVDGGTAFTVEGEGFTDETVVLFGGNEADVDLVDEELTGTTPEALATGPVTVRVIDDVTGEVTIEEGFTYFQPLEVDTVQPSMLPVDGGPEVTITGSGLTADSQVTVGTRSAPSHTFVDSTQLRFIAPSNTAGPKDVRVTNADESIVVDDAVTYVAPVELEAVTPPYGSADGGDEVTVHGSQFDESLQVLFNEVSAQVDEIAADGTSATVQTPPGQPGTADVRVETDDDGAVLSDGFYYLGDDSGPATLDAVIPDRGETTGGERVYLFGQFDELSSPAVEFGTQQADVIDVDDQTIAVDTPQVASPGSVDVTVDNGAEVLTADDAFIYYTPLSVDDLTPDEGDASGGDDVVISGSGFDAADEVRLGGMSVDFDVVDDETIEFTTPEASPGPVDLRITTDDGRSIHLDEAFEFLGHLEIWNFSPTRGAIAGNTYVEIHGTGFTDGTQVTFGGLEAQEVQRLDPHTLAVRTPPHDSGPVEVVAEQSGEESTAPELYTYFNPGLQMGGAGGNPIEGAVNVTVFSMAGGPIEDAFVMLSTSGDTEYQGLTNAGGQITFSGPDVYGPQTITATAVDHSSATVQTVDAENITVFLMSGEGDPPAAPPPPTATFRGHIDGLDKIDHPDPNELRMAIVQTTRPSIDDDLPDPGGQNIVYEDGEYVIQTRVGELALVALAGLYNVDTEEFTPDRMGVARYLTAADGGEYEVDISIDIPLDSSIDFKFDGSPIGAAGGPDTNRAQLFMDLGIDGIFGPVEEFTTESDVTVIDTLAKLQGDLDDATYEIMAFADTSGDAPLAQAHVTGIDELGQLHSTPPLASTLNYIVPDAGTAPDGGLVQWDLHGPVQPDLYYFIVQTFMGEPVWDIFVSGDENSFTLPEFPDLSEYELENDDGEPAVPVPYPDGTYIMIGVGFSSPDLAVETFGYDQLGTDTADTISLSPLMIQMP